MNTRYAAAVDRRDWELLAACFSPDVETVGWGRAAGRGRGPLLDFIKGVAHFHTTMHMMGNHFVHVDGEAAELDCYSMLTHHYERVSEPAEMNVSHGRYFDAMERVGGAWRIARRGGEPRWAQSDGRGLEPADPISRALLDRAQIHDRLMSCALGLDERDWDRVAGCFASTFEARYGDRTFTEVDELIAFVRGVELFESTSHFLARPWIEVRGDEAFALTYAMITHSPGDRLSAGPMYRDRLVREGDTWRVAERGITLPDLAGAADVSGAGAASPVQTWLVDRELIRHATTGWNLALDRDDVEGALAWLAPEFSLTLGPDGPVLADRDAVARALARHDGARPTCHWPGNQLVDLAGNEARVETYVYRSEREPSGPWSTGWSGGAQRLVDRMVRVDGRWLIADRRVTTNRVS